MGNTSYRQVPDGAAVCAISDDFMSATTAGALNWNISTSGAGSTVSVATTPINSTTRVCGALRFLLGTANNSRSGIGLNLTALTYGYAAHIQEWRVGVNTLSTVGTEYTIQFGFFTTHASTADNVNGAYFEYNRFVNGNFWSIACANNNTRSKAATTVAVAANTFYTFGIYVNDAGTRVDFFINNVNVGNIVNNIPTTNLTGAGFKLSKNASNATSGTPDCILDRFSQTSIFTPPRS